MAAPLDVDALVEAALRLSPERRSEFIDWACGDDVVLKENVVREMTLRLADASNSGLDAGSPPDDDSATVSSLKPPIPSPPTAAPTPTSAADSDADFIMSSDAVPQIEFRPGMLIGGRYKLVRSIGEGGMGTVWIAEQFEPVRRRVALKLIKAGVNSSQVVARFEAERQALAVMNHPHIARILDGGSIDTIGTPYFVMELVKGIPITKYCDKHRLTLAQRIELFIPVCEAIQHAHQKGIIHRDIKPSNILVAEIDGQAVPKVIDFGVAKAIGLALTDKTLNTVIGAVVGTPQYMSPEQADPDYPDIDTRSDVYSLGVLLYELMTGTPPFDAKQLGRAAILEILRIIREVDPPTPSSKLSTDEGLPSISANRSMEPARLTRLVRGELDWIVMKTLEKDRTRRYESASRLADDLRRFLSGEQISAAPPSRLYRLQKFLRRHRVMVTAASLVVLSLATALVVSLLSLQRARYETKQAELAREQEAEQRQIAEASQREEAIQRRLAETATDQAFAALQSFSDEFIERRFMSQTYLSPVDRDLLTKALQQWEAFSAVQGSTLKALRVQAEGAFRVAKLRQLLGEPEAESGFRETIRLLNLAIVSAPEDVQLLHSLSDTAVALGKSRLASGDAGEALQFADQGLQSVQTARKLHDSEILQRTEANAHNARAVILRAQRKQEESLAAYQAARELLEPLYANQVKMDGSEEVLANVCNNMGNLLVELGRFPEAEQRYQQGLKIRQRSVADHPGDPESLEGLGLSYYGQGDLAARLGELPAALKHYQESAQVFQRLVTEFPQNPTYWFKLANVLSNRASMEGRTGQLESATMTTREAVAAHTTLVKRFPLYPNAQKILAGGVLNLAQRLEESKQMDEATQQRERALAILRQLVSDPQASDSDRIFLAKALLAAGMGANSRGQIEQADQMINEGLSIYDSLPENLLEFQMDRSEGYWRFGVVLLKRSEFERAESYFSRSTQAIENVIQAQPGSIQHRASLRFVLLRIGDELELAGQGDAAIRYFQQSAQVAAELLQIVPDREDHVLAQAGALNRLALAYARTLQGDLATQSLDFSDASLDHFLLTHPDSTEAVVLRAGNSVNRYDLESKLEPNERRLNLLTTAIEALNNIRQQTPQHRTMQMFLHNALLRRAEAYDRLRRFLEAAADWQELARLPNADDVVMFRSKSAQSLIRGGEVDPAIEIMDSLASVQNPATIFARARVFALAHEQRPDAQFAERCVAEIERLIKMGFDDAARLRSDPDLKSVQDFEPFQKIVAQLEDKEIN